MFGPKPHGHWSRVCPDDHGMLKRGQRYRVVQAFVDFDGDTHAVGETWTFLGSNFSAYEDGASWFVSLDDEGEWHIRMQQRPHEQAHVLDHLSAFIAPLPMSNGGSPAA